MKKDRTTHPTPGIQIKVTSKQNIANMKAGQVGYFTFIQMRFSQKIMIMGKFGDLVCTHPEKLNYELRNQLGFYKPLTYQECLDAFDFSLNDAIEFERLFKDFKPQIL